MPGGFKCLVHYVLSFELNSSNLPTAAVELSDSNLNTIWTLTVTTLEYYDPVQNGPDTHQKLAIICAFSLGFNEIALDPIDSPVPLFNVEYVRLSDRFCGRNNIEMGGGVKENKDVRDQKTLFNKHSVSTLFARDCNPCEN